MLLKSPEAILDIETIWDYIAQDKLSAAEKFIYELEEKFKLLEFSPFIGRVFNPKSKKYNSMRVFPIGKYMIFYLPIEKGVKIYRVLHGAMDFNSNITT